MTTQPSALSTATSLKGYVVATYVKYKGKKLGPYYSRTWKERGKIKREYVKSHDLERVRAACQAHREKRNAQLECTRNFARLAGNLHYLDRIAKRADKNPLRPQDYEFLDRVSKNGIEISGRPTLKSSPVRGKCRIAAMGANAAPTQSSVSEIPDERASATSGHRPTKPFMYPSLTKMKNTFLAELKSIFHSPIRDKRNAETKLDKLCRWANTVAEFPRTAPNIESDLPNWLSTQELEDCVDRWRELLPPAPELVNNPRMFEDPK